MSFFSTVMVKSFLLDHKRMCSGVVVVSSGGVTNEIGIGDDSLFTSS